MSGKEFLVQLSGQVWRQPNVIVSVSLEWRGSLGELFWRIQIPFLKIHNTIPIKRQRQLIPQTIQLIITFFAPGFHPPFFPAHVNAFYTLV